MANERDYLAIIQFAGGCGSFSRSSNKHEAVEQVRKIVSQDFRGVFNLSGAEVKVAVYDITGHDNVNWGHFGMFDSDTHEKLEIVPEVVEVTLPKYREKARKRA